MNGIALLALSCPATEQCALISQFDLYILVQYIQTHPTITEAPFLKFPVQLSSTRAQQQVIAGSTRIQTSCFYYAVISSIFF